MGAYELEVVTVYSLFSDFVERNFFRVVILVWVGFNDLVIGRRVEQWSFLIDGEDGAVDEGPAGRVDVVLSDLF